MYHINQAWSTAMIAIATQNHECSLYFHFKTIRKPKTTMPFNVGRDIFSLPK
jgi:hypothetical protein